MIRLGSSWIVYAIVSLLILLFLAFSTERKRRLYIHEYSYISQTGDVHNPLDSSIMPTTEIEGTTLDSSLVAIRKQRTYWEKISTLLYGILMTSSGSVLILVQLELLAAPWWIGWSSVAMIFTTALLMRRSWKILKGR